MKNKLLILIFVILLTNTAYALCPGPDDYKKYDKFIPGVSDVLNVINRNIGLRIERTDTLRILPDDLKKYINKVEIDITPYGRKIEYFDKNNRQLAYIKSIIKEEKGYTVIDLKNIAIGPNYRGGGRGTEFFGKFVRSTKSVYDNKPMILHGQAASLAVANYWGYNGAKFARNTFRKTINNRLIIALEDKGLYKYYDETTKSEKILKDTKGWQFVKGEKPKDIPVPDTRNTFWFEF